MMAATIAVEMQTKMQIKAHVKSSNIHDAKVCVCVREKQKEKNVLDRMPNTQK